MEVAPPARIPANKVAARKCGLNAQVLSGKTARVFSRVFLFMKFSFSRARLSVLSLACVSTFSASAQSDSNHSLGEVVVTASRNPQLLSATSAHTTVITREDIENSQAPDLITLLQRDAGLQRTQNGGIGTVSSTFLRGLASLDTLVLIDGVPQNKQDASGTVSLEHIMLDNVERVEVVRGNVSAVYGSGAIGGVIQIFTRNEGRDPSASLSLEVGPRGTAKITAGASLRIGDTTLNAGASRYTTDGFSSINPLQYVTANPDADGYQNVSSHAAISQALSKDHRIGLQLTQSEGRTNYDATWMTPSDVQFSRVKLNQATAYSDNTWGAWHSRISYSEQSDSSYSFEGNLYGFNTKVGVLTWVNTLPLGEYWLGTAGLEEQHQHVDTYSDDIFAPPYDRDRTTDAVFIGMEGCFGAATLQFNVRNDKVASLSQDTFYAGAGYSLTDAWKITASSSSAFNAPPLGYLYAPGYGNPLLKPELAQSHEVGLQYEKDKQLLRATYFDTRMQDQLEYVGSQFANVNQTRNTGMELSYRATYGNTEARGSWTEQNPVNALTGQVLQRRARTMVSLGLSQKVGAWNVGGDIRYAGERPDVYYDPITYVSTSTNLPAYTVLDLTLSYRLSSEWLFKSRLDNVTDEKYQTVYGYNQQPQSLYAGLTWTPKR
jgi:vitamin B12 transporter